MQKIEKKKKYIREIAVTIIYLIFVICILYNLIFLINTTISEKNYFKLFGICLFSMDSDLMQDDINKNDLVIIKEVKNEELQKGDIIAYEINENTRINKIINENEQGYTTMSNKNLYPDIEKVTDGQIIGKKVVNVPGFGIVLEILQSKITSIFILLYLAFKLWYDGYMQTKQKERARKKKMLSKG